jgi:hypothetical protein
VGRPETARRAVSLSAAGRFLLQERLNGTLMRASGGAEDGGYPGDVGRRAWIAIVVVAAAVAGGVVLAGLALGGSDEPSSAQEYQAAVVQARDRVDFALGRLSKAQSLEELISRMDEASASINGARSELDDTAPPDDLAEEDGRLVAQLGVLSQDVQGTADQLRDPASADLLLGAQGLSFDSWDRINAVLVEMKAKGVVVPLLSRHRTQS